MSMDAYQSQNRQQFREQLQELFVLTDNILRHGWNKRRVNKLLKQMEARIRALDRNGNVQATEETIGLVETCGFEYVRGYSGFYFKRNLGNKTQWTSWRR